MRIARIIAKTVFFILLLLDIAVFGSVFYLTEVLSDDFKIKKGDTLNITSPLPVTAVYNGSVLSSRHTETGGEKLAVDLKMFGVIPFSKAQVEVVDELQVAVLGQPFGMKLYTKGVLVVEINSISANKGNLSPARTAGIKLGDYILSVDGKKISTNEDLVEIVENSGGKALEFKINRKGKTIKLFATPERENETNKYKIGIWVRDSSAGIGTLTFYSPATNIICGLGHGVCDEDTGSLLALSSGEVVAADIYAVEKGASGAPGQLKGRLKNDILGKISLNCEGGIYSRLTGEIPLSRLTEVALKNEVKNGNAQIYCTVNGTTPRPYSCKISLKAGKRNAKTQNMIVTVTDKELLKITGGIVQGLSGSPILQNGKLIGAVTHVLIDDPTKGYAIFAENMLETAKSVEQNQNLKDAG